MESISVAIDTADLRKGMYVSKLDRPWLETPFVFQGFEVSNPVEIDILRSCCDFVHVDADRSNLTPAQSKALKDAVPSGSRRARTSASGKPAPGKWMSLIRDLMLRYNLTRYFGGGQRDASGHYPISSTVRREADRASAAFELACAFHRGMLEQARKTGSVDIAAARRTL